MKKLSSNGVALLASLIMAAAGQAQEGYLDVFIAKIKPEKRGDFEAVVKRMVDANRKNGGDVWILSEVAYGEGNTFMFTSLRSGFGDAEKAGDAFMAALAKAGQTQALAAFNNTIVSTRTELRRRRQDLSVNPITDPAALLKKVGESRWLRTTTMRVRPGHAAEFEEQLKAVTAALGSSGKMFLVSQAAAGTAGAYYISSLAKSMAEYDDAVNLRKVMSESAYKRYTEVLARAVVSTDSTISRYIPELSNPPAGVADADPGFWKPKAAAPVKPKAEAKKQ